MFHTNHRALFAALLLALACLPAWSQRSAEAPKPDTWYLETSMMTLDAGTRFVGSAVVSNPSSSPIYIRTSVESVAVVDGERQRAPVENSALRAYPEEFVLRPGDSFTVRIVSDPSQFKGDAQSFYVKFRDVTHLQEDSSKGGSMQTGYVLAFEALVSVNRTPVSKLTADQFALQRNGDQYTLKNLTGRHLYLDRGGLCPASKPVLVDCKAFAGFPRQTFLPNEIVQLKGAGDDAFVGLMVFTGLNLRDRAEILYLPTAAAAAAGAAAAARAP